MNKTLLMLLLLPYMAFAQDVGHDMAKRLGMVNVWEKKEFLELSQNDQQNRVVYTDAGTAANYSMDLAGYLLCVSHFESASNVADGIYKNAKIILLDAELPSSAGQALDTMFMDQAYRDGRARMHIVRRYKINDAQQLELSFISNDKERKFIMKVVGS